MEKSYCVNNRRFNYSSFEGSETSSNKKTKVQIFLGGKTEDLMFHLIDNIIIHIGTNNAPYKSENALFEELKKIKELIITQHPNCKNRIFVSPAR